MNNHRVLLYIAHSYLHGFQLLDSERDNIILYLRSLLVNEKFKKHRKQKLIKLLGSCNAVNGFLMGEVLYNKRKKRSHDNK